MKIKTVFLQWLSPLYRAVVAIAALSSSMGLAEGTKEVIADGGLYSGVAPGSVPMNILSWNAAWSTLTLDANHVGELGTPEGMRAVRAYASQPWVGYGMFFVDFFGSTVVVEQDCSDYAGGHVRFWLKSTNSLTVEIETLSTTGSLLKGRYIVSSTTNRWTEIVVPLSSFSPAINFGRVRGLFLITVVTGAGPVTWYVDHVRWTKPLQRINLSPASATVSPGDRTQLNAQGVTADGEAILYLTFTASGGILHPRTPTMSTVFTATTNAETTTVVAADPHSGMTATSRVTVAESFLDSFYLLVDSRPPSIILDTDSKLLAFGSESPLNVSVETVLDTRCEGQTSLRIMVTNPTTNSYAGVSIQAGLEDSPDTETTDMTARYDGVIMFCLKAPPDLNGKLQVSIRSGNVIAGMELSRVRLEDASLFDNQWRTVAIPVRYLAGPKPWADLSRIKNYFTVSVIGVTGGPQPFYIDDVRWRASHNIPLRLSGNQSSPGEFRFFVEGPPGMRFRTDKGDNLFTWQTMTTNGISSEGSPVEIIDSGISDSSKRFYRAVELPPLP